MKTKQRKATIFYKKIEFIFFLNYWKILINSLMNNISKDKFDLSKLFFTKKKFIYSENLSLNWQNNSFKMLNIDVINNNSIFSFILIYIKMSFFN